VFYGKHTSRANGEWTGLPTFKALSVFQVPIVLVPIVTLLSVLKVDFMHSSRASPILKTFNKRRLI